MEIQEKLPGGGTIRAQPVLLVQDLDRVVTSQTTALVLIGPRSGTHQHVFTGYASSIGDLAGLGPSQGGTKGQQENQSAFHRCLILIPILETLYEPAFLASLMRFARKGHILGLYHSPIREGITAGANCQRFLGRRFKVHRSKFKVI